MWPMGLLLKEGWYISASDTLASTVVQLSLVQVWHSKGYKLGTNYILPIRCLNLGVKTVKLMQIT